MLSCFISSLFASDSFDRFVGLIQCLLIVCADLAAVQAWLLIAPQIRSRCWAAFAFCNFSHYFYEHGEGAACLLPILVAGIRVSLLPQFAQTLWYLSLLQYSLVGREKQNNSLSTFLLSIAPKAT